MRILVVCHRFPFPPKRGGKIRPFNIIKHMSASHDVTVCSLVRSDEEADEIHGISDHCDRFVAARVNDPVQQVRMVANLATTTPSSMGYFNSRNLARAVNDAIDREKPGLVFVHCSSVAPYVAEIQGPVKILDFGDMDSQKWLDYRRFKPFPLSLGYWLEGAKLARTEESLASKFDLCTATTRAELEHLDSIAKDQPTGWFPNGVDNEFFSPDGESHDPKRICFVGRMDYFPNQQAMYQFCEHVWPVIREKLPEMHLDIVGADPIPKVRALEELPGVTVTGSVPDVRPFVRRALAMVAPLSIARGTQNKILESMAMGTPVITSSIAAGGVDAKPGQHLITADSVEEQVNAILEIQKNSQHRDALSLSGRQRVMNNHAWPNSMKRLDELIRGVCPEYGCAVSQEAKV